MSARRVLAGVLTIVALGGCTEVPTSSDPIPIESIPAGQSAVPAPGPSRNASPRQIVQGFLSANESTDFGHAAARKFLTTQAATTWKDTTVTVLDSEDNVNYDAKLKQVTVTGAVVGTLGSTGIYTPSLQGVGDGGPPAPTAFKIVLVNGQYRIASLRDGLILGLDGYNSVYRPYSLYFFDQDRQYLVPDLRASALDGRALQNWLLRQLAIGPRPSLVDALGRPAFPVSPSAEILATPGNPLGVAVPRSARLSGANRSRLAAQIAHTLDPTTSLSQNAFTITDGGKPITIPGGGTQFVVGQFTSYDRPTPAADVYYLRDGRVTNAEGRQLTGAIATGPALQSFAIARRGGLQVAGVAGGKLYIGTPSAGLKPTPVTTPVSSRPEWAPGLGEVWVAAGANLYRVQTGLTVQPVDVPSNSIPARSQVLALRFSPEGSRVALVVQTPVTGTAGTAPGIAQRLYVGSVVRTAGQARVTTLQPISPEGVGVTDVSWIESTRLSAIGYLTGSQDSRIFEANVDGSDWSARGIANLPGGPDYSTVVAGQLAWVSANGSVWEQSGSSWLSPGPGDPTPGEAPVYLE